MNTHYNGQDLLWEVDYIEHTLALEHNVLVGYLLQCPLNFLANFSLLKEERRYVKRNDFLSMVRVLLSENCQKFC